MKVIWNSVEVIWKSIWKYNKNIYSAVSWVEVRVGLWWNTKGMVYFIQSLIEVLENIYFNSRVGWDMPPFSEIDIFSDLYES